MWSLLSLCSTWFPGAVIIALNFLSKGAWLTNQVMCLHCPPCRSSELLQVGGLVASIFEKIAPFGLGEDLLKHQSSVVDRGLSNIP